VWFRPGFGWVINLPRRRVGKFGVDGASAIGLFVANMAKNRLAIGDRTGSDLYYTKNLEMARVGWGRRDARGDGDEEGSDFFVVSGRDG